MKLRLLIILVALFKFTCASAYDLVVKLEVLETGETITEMVPFACEDYRNPVVICEPTMNPEDNTYLFRGLPYKAIYISCARPETILSVMWSKPLPTPLS